MKNSSRIWPAIKKLKAVKIFRSIILAVLTVLLVTIQGYAIKGNAEGAKLNLQQQRRISGTVTDNLNRPLPGVTVVIKGTTQGTATGMEGEYVLDNVPADATLVFSFVGMQTQEVLAGNQTTINVTLMEETIGLEEVVAIGYGTQRKATLTGSVTEVGYEQLSKTPTANLSNSMAGLMPGLVSLQRSGQPGEDNSTFLIRGNSTTGSNTPLVLVDGISEPNWQRINPNDVEQVSVLKDAAAAIYGVQAGNGVILITTKRGKTGKPTFDVTYNQGIYQLTRFPKMASAATLAEYGNEYLVRTGFEEKWTQEEIQKFRDGTDPRYPNTDWVDAVIKDFSTQESANLNIRGGSDNMRYSLSGSFQHKGDILKGGIHDFKGYTVRSNIDSDVSRYITLSLDMNVGFDRQVEPAYSSWYYNRAMNPQYPVYYPGGYYSDPPSDYGNHPLLVNSGGGGDQKQDDKRFTGKLSYDIEIPWVKGLGIDGYFVYNESNYFRKYWTTPWKYYGYNWDTGEVIEFQGGYLPKPTLTERYNKSDYTLMHSKIKYERQFTDHYINAFIAAEQSEGKSNYVEAYRRDYVSEAIREIFAGSADLMQTDGSSSNNARRNFFGRLSYNYKEKYLIDFNFRYDGSYRFPKDGRWGFFPGISAAYRISEESFMDGLDYLDNLKLRVSYGQIGNDAISPFQYLQEYNLRSISYHFGAPQMSSPVPGVYAGVSPNPNITWEVSTINNIGLDVMVFKNLIGLSVDVFSQRRTNILTTRALALPEYTGISLPAENIGIVDNKGFEVQLTHSKQFPLQSFQYTFSGNFSFARSNVVDIAEAENVPEYQKAEGHILGAGLYWESIGIFRTAEQLASLPVYPGTEVGDPIYRDVDENGKIDGADRVRFDKSVIPEIQFGFNVNMGYKNFTAFAHFAGQGSAWWYIGQNARVDLNAPAELLDNRYRPGSMDSKYPWIPQFGGGSEVSSLRSTFWLQNAAFLRLKTLELSYNLPQSLISKVKVSNMRVFVNGSNLFTWTKLMWYDPEGSNEGGNFYPQSKIYNLGVQLTF